jgi:hypothetical protein
MWLCTNRVGFGRPVRRLREAVPDLDLVPGNARASDAAQPRIVEKEIARCTAALRE